MKDEDGERKKAEEKLRMLRLENVYLQEEIKTGYNFEEIVGTSAAVKQVFQSIEQVAGTDATVLLVGETGTGKELVARALYNLSPRKDKARVKVNCAALPSTSLKASCSVMSICRSSHEIA